MAKLPAEVPDTYSYNETFTSRPKRREVEPDGNLPKRGDRHTGGAGFRAGDDNTLGADLDPKMLMKRWEREEKGYKKGGAVKSASSRADGIAQRGKTRGMMK